MPRFAHTNLRPIHLMLVANNRVTDEISKFNSFIGHTYNVAADKS